MIFSGGGGGLREGVIRGNFGTGVCVSILIPTIIINLAFEKKPFHILDFTET